MKTLLDRLLDYVSYDTQSRENTGEHPTTEKQMVLAKHLAEELKEIGAEHVVLSEQGYVYASIPPSPGYEKAPVLGFISHMDTSDAASGADIHPQIFRWEGEKYELGNSGKFLDPALFPSLDHLIGDTLIATDGTTLLGADDKAGIAEIMTAAERILKEAIPHGALRIAFTPDEEIGEGTMFFDTKLFGADYAYTVDGGGAGEIEYQNFNAAVADVRITGFSVHPGSAKNIMRNAQKTAIEFNSMLPAMEVPEHTEGFEGFYHLIASEGTVSKANMTYLIRDHDANSFENRKKVLRSIAEKLNEKYGKDTVTLTIRDQYRNMEEVIRKYPFLIEIACDAVRKAGLEPAMPPIRGGTDGAMLSWKGLPCPNLGTGGYNFHGECEFASIREMEKSVEILLNIIRSFADRK